jgi:hypothetical protein
VAAFASGSRTRSRARAGFQSLQRARGRLSLAAARCRVFWVDHIVWSLMLKAPEGVRPRFAADDQRRSDGFQR